MAVSISIPSIKIRSVRPLVASIVIAVPNIRAQAVIRWAETNSEAGRCSGFAITLPTSIRAGFETGSVLVAITAPTFGGNAWVLDPDVDLDDAQEVASLWLPENAAVCEGVLALIRQLLDSA